MQSWKILKFICRYLKGKFEVWVRIWIVCKSYNGFRFYCIHSVLHNTCINRRTSLFLILFDHFHSFLLFCVFSNCFRLFCFCVYECILSRINSRTYFQLVCIKYIFGHIIYNVITKSIVFTRYTRWKNISFAYIFFIWTANAKYSIWVAPILIFKSTFDSMRFCINIKLLEFT